MKLQLATPPRPWMRRRWLKRLFGRLVFPTAADPQRPGVSFNRYPQKIIGVAVYFGGRRYLSWVWPVWIVGLRLTSEQLERQHRELLANEKP